MTSGNPTAPEHSNRVGHGQRQATEMPSRRHGTDVDRGVERVLPHADAVPQDGSPAEGRSGVDGQDGHLGDLALGGPPADSSADSSAGGHPARAQTMSRSVKVDLPAPGAPVSPTVKGTSAR